MIKSIYTELAPKPIGTYSQAIQAGNTVYLSGQIPLNPETMQLCDEDIKLQIAQVLENLSVVCDAAGGSLSHIVKLSVYLTDLANFHLVNDAMLRYFVEPYPARVAIGVSELPRGALIEMDGVMVLP
jgi:reactive intermediate/imine deaminase